MQAHTVYSSARRLQGAECLKEYVPALRIHHEARLRGTSLHWYSVLVSIEARARERSAYRSETRRQRWDRYIMPAIAVDGNAIDTLRGWNSCSCCCRPRLTRDSRAAAGVALFSSLRHISREMSRFFIYRLTSFRRRWKEKLARSRCAKSAWASSSRRRMKFKYFKSCNRNPLCAEARIILTAAVDLLQICILKWFLAHFVLLFIHAFVL